MLRTEYMGLELRSPVIVSSGPLTQNIVSLEKCEEAGAGAVVLKSIFEEQIEKDVSNDMEKNEEYLAHSSADEFFAASSRDYYIDRYMKLLTEAKKKLSIPVIASVCAKTMDNWPITVQYKNGILQKMRPGNWYTTRGNAQVFESMTDYLSAFEETVYQNPETRTQGAQWKNRFKRSYKNHYGVDIDFPKWDDIKGRYGRN